MKIQASKLRSKALPPASGSTYGGDAVKRARRIGKEALEKKFPDGEVTDAAIQMTVNLEIKYELFNQEDGIIKTGQLDNKQVFYKLYLVYILVASGLHLNCIYVASKLYLN